MTDEQPDSNKKTSFWDINQYSERTRKIVFWVIAGFLLGVTGFAIFIVSPLLTTSGVPEPDATPTATQPAAPTTNPDSSEDEFEQQQEQIIADDPENPAEAPYDEQEEIANQETLMSIASNGVLAYCTIQPGDNEDVTLRQTRMQPWFHPDSSTYKNVGYEFWEERICSVEAVTEPEHDEQENITVYVGVAWVAKSDTSSEDMQSGYTQYKVILDDSGILSVTS